MKKHFVTILVGIFIIGPLYGLMLYLIDNQVEFYNIIMFSLIFGIGMAFGEICIFERLRNRNKK